MIAVVVSSANRCWYCQVAHGAAVRQMGRDPVLGDAGFTEAAIWDICDVAGLFAMTNRVASGVGMQPIPEYHAASR